MSWLVEIARHLFSRKRTKLQKKKKKEKWIKT